jgi:peptide/nickel transport system substrate-binding protein
VRLDARSGLARGRTALPGAPAAIAGGANSLWVTDAARNQLLRARPGDGSVADEIPVGTQPGDVAVGDGSVWVASTAAAGVKRINVATDAVTQTVPLGDTPSALAFVHGALWVGDPSDGALLRVDPASGQVVQTLTVGLDPSAIAGAGRTLWVAGYDTGTVIELDPHSATPGTPILTVHVGQGPAAIVFGAGSLWVANRLDGTVSRVDPATGTVVASRATGSAPIALAATGHSIWVANQYSATVSRIDTRGDAVTSTAVGGSPTALTSSGSSVWVSVRPADLHRGGTLVLATTRRFFSFDAQIDTEAPPAELFGLVDDGLVAYDHTPGPQGLDLVPDLALTLPSPTDGGRTYTFRLRPGLRYATGRAVRASDFVRGVRRLFRLGAPGASFLSGLVGGRLCLARLASCNLAGAVAADDSSRTITFRLTSPDPDFLFKLAGGFVIPVPRGTPPNDVGTHPIPGTGPYRFGTIGRRVVILVRNPRFREWSHAAQPDGNPDRIEWRFGLRAGQEASSVLRGSVDWTDDLPSHLPLLERQHPSQIHSNVFPTVFFLQINTNDPPFDRLRTRQALNYAIDRAAVVRSYGGSLANSPSCQIIPSGLPGYHRYCPYTLDPGSTGRWSARDLRKARLLVDGTRTRGAAVTIWDISDSGAEPVIPIVTRALRQLGYRPRVRVLTSRAFGRTTAAERARVQLVPVTEGPDWPSAAELYSLFLACGGAFNWHQFCDPRLDREAVSAEALRLSKPTRSAELWARIDRQLVNRAVWVPLTDQRIIDIVSRRVTGYQFSPVYHFLPAQASLRPTS